MSNAAIGKKRLVVGLACLALFLGQESAVNAAPTDDALERANELARQGNEHGRQGELDLAIKKFKEAQAIAPRALFACNIGLANARKQRWPEAHYFLNICRQRWATDEGRPIQDWVSTRINESLAKLETGPFGPVLIQVEPLDASIQIQGFDGGGLVPSGKRLWLPQGEHQVIISHPDHEPQTHVININSGSELAFSWTFESKAEPPALPPDNTSLDNAGSSEAPIPAAISEFAIPEAKPAPSDAHWFALGIGVAFLAAGGITHSVALETLADSEQPQTRPDYEQKRSSYKLQRTVTYGLYGAGSLSLGLGIYWALTQDREETPPVGISANGDSATVLVGGRW